MKKEWTIDDAEVFQLISVLYGPIEGTIMQRALVQYIAEQQMHPHPHQHARRLMPTTIEEYAIHDVLQLMTMQNYEYESNFFADAANHRHSQPLRYDQAVSRAYSLMRAGTTLGILPSLLLEASDRYCMYLEDRPLYRLRN